MKMSEAAKSALINAHSSAQGVVIDDHAPVLAELRQAGLVGPQFGLTRKGSIEAMKAKRAAEDKAFGL